MGVDREGLLQAIAEARKPLLRALAERGVHIQEPSDLVPAYVPLSKDIVEVLLECLPQTTQPNVRAYMVRLLAATKVKYDPTLLLEMFDSSHDELFKWTIANTLESSGPPSIGPWLLKALRTREHAEARQMLCLAAGKLLPRDEARAVLKEVFEDLPGHAAMGLGRCGTPEDLEFLRAYLPRVEQLPKERRTWIRRAINQAVAKIEKRAQRPRRREKGQPTG